ncbi:APH(3'') family aminoglycoside O-phosphotransferase [Streptomyces sp. XM4193]|uniref:APH(3'') family aminoglycoside O-phosphotransferase n=1 Tax=Streptomyces sp. XM4193 TaxID=2929782 RepID=UPI001FFAC78C|nr:APH(3'') family aminoglycoside O-phosphotransferase [Streptomyces sp. XM4193]MCK1794498.1 APH(3'') family aminoglycoside O-phosphotransferase [Streptomyces sp. XM4193]
MNEERGRPLLLPSPGGDGEGWERVEAGESGARVFRSTKGDRYAKCVPPCSAAELEGERDRLVWLGSQDVTPGPRVLDWRSGDTGACLVTSAVAGVTADRLSARELNGAWAGIADTVRALHAVPASECPFRRSLGTVVDLAAEVVGRDAVNPEFLPVEQQQSPPRELLARIQRQLPERLAQETADTVVCHGDLCLPNIVVDPRSLTVSGLIDLGRLGAADRHADLALLLANSRETWPDEEWAVDADRAFADRYGLVPDPERLAFYLHLDPLTWG